MAKQIRPDITLVLAPPWGIDEPHLGIAYLTTYLKLKGYYPYVYDINIEVHSKISDDLKVLWHASAQPDWMNFRTFEERTLPKFEEIISEAVKRILDTEAKTIGFSVTSSNRLFTLELIRRIKEKDPSKIVIVGGIGCYTHEEQLIFLPHGIVDVFVIGEGEETIVEILDALENNKGLDKIKGIMYWQEGSYSKFIPRALIQDLDSIPFPTFDEFPLDLYYYSRQSLEEFTMKHCPILTSRGCVNKCAFCNDTNLWPKYRHRSAQHVCDELLYEAKKRNITAFVFQDLAINGDMKFLTEMCELFKKILIEMYKFPVTWISNVFVRKQMSYEVFKLMKDAGAHTLMFGLESGSDSVLKTMRKGYSSDLAAEVLRNCKTAGINVWINIIVGFPGETEKEFKETLVFLRKNKDYIDKIQNLNTCNVVDNSLLNTESDNYSVVLPDDDMSYLYWHSADQTNNFEIRKSRLLRVVELAKELCIPVENMNIQGEENKLR